MKIYIAYYQYYEDVTVVGAFSTQEAAKDALTHWYDSKMAKEHYVYYELSQGYVDEYVLDEYTTTHMSPLAKALEE